MSIIEDGVLPSMNFTVVIITWNCNARCYIDKQVTCLSSFMVQGVYTFEASCMIIHCFQMVYLGCSFSQFRCTNGQCISSSSRCNGIRECTDGTDERNCSKFPIYFDCCELQLYLSTTCYYLYSFLSKWCISMQQWYVYQLLWSLWWESIGLQYPVVGCN